ncbi:MAG: cytochrome c oxidase assembly protein [Gemmatimonadales bacterium]
MLALRLLAVVVPGVLYATAGQHRSVTRPQACMFYGGLLLLCSALVGPLENRADQLQSAHMAQHLVLITAAPILLLLGRPERALDWMPRPIRIALGRRWTHIPPAAAFAVHVALLTFWHLPGPYDAALRSEGLHALEHASFFGSAIALWYVVLAPVTAPGLRPAARIPYLVAMSVVGGCIGAVLTFSAAPLYDSYAHAANALDDQQLAGLLMWIPGGLIYMGMGAILFIRWLRDAETRADREVVWQRT